MVVIDGPPGNSCAAVAAIKPAKLVVLVAEPAPFGIHDMLQTLYILKKLQKSVVIITNKSQRAEELVALLAERGFMLAVSIPLKIAHHEALLNGEILSQRDQHVCQLLQQAVTLKMDKL